MSKPIPGKYKVVDLCVNNDSPFCRKLFEGEEIEFAGFEDSARPDTHQFYITSTRNGSRLGQVAFMAWFDIHCELGHFKCITPCSDDQFPLFV